MHYLYFVKVNKDEAQNAREAINKAQRILDENAFIASGYWGSGKCDWYVMGGRWSGEFAGLLLKGDFFEEVRKLIRSKEADGTDRDFVSTADIEKYAEDIQSLWLAHGGKGVNPYARDNHLFGGCDDDAVVLTDEIIRALKAKYAEDVEYFDDDSSEERSVSALSAEDIGHWLVVVDYHN